MGLVKTSSTITFKQGEEEAYIDDIDADISNIIREINRGIKLIQATTVQRNSLTNLYNGLTIYNTTTKKLNVYIDGAWQEITSS